MRVFWYLKSFFTVYRLALTPTTPRIPIQRSLHRVSVLSKHQDAASSPHTAVSAFSGCPSGWRGRHGGCSKLDICYVGSSNYARDGTRIACINLVMTALHPNLTSSSALEDEYTRFASLSAGSNL
ncbi:hypothetical protein CPC08DRAFT_704852 [Agrocybe pediades]|nr:hypothetical protein CPC08DRAFT_704852 [Agrocybe pediades]